MPENNKTFQRWYDEDKILSKCILMLESAKDTIKHQTATFLMDKIITQPPYVDMLSHEIFDMVTSESRQRRWYDFDEVMKILMELLRHSSNEIRREIAVAAITFMEDLSLDKNKSIEIKISEEEK